MGEPDGNMPKDSPFILLFKKRLSQNRNVPNYNQVTKKVRISKLDNQRLSLLFSYDNRL